MNTWEYVALGLGITAILWIILEIGFAVMSVTAFGVEIDWGALAKDCVKYIRCLFGIHYRKPIIRLVPLSGIPFVIPYRSIGWVCTLCGKEHRQ